MLKNGVVQDVKIKNNTDVFCEPCQYGKPHRLPFPRKTEPKKWLPGEFIHSDLVGPMPVESLSGAKYYIEFKDDASGYRHIEFLKHKSDATEKLLNFDRLVSNRFNRSIKFLLTDNGGEYFNSVVSDFMLKKALRPNRPLQIRQSKMGEVKEITELFLKVHAPCYCKVVFPSSCGRRL